MRSPSRVHTQADQHAQIDWQVRRSIAMMYSKSLTLPVSRHFGFRGCDVDPIPKIFIRNEVCVPQAGIISRQVQQSTLPQGTQGESYMY